MADTESAEPVRAAEGQDPIIGKVLNERFTVLERIGSGGMGRVYKAMQAPLDRVVALKILNPMYSVEQDPAFAKRFFLEASVSSKLTHPNTITIFDYGRTDEGIFFIAMEYLQGRTLHQAIAVEGGLPPPRAVHIARQICRALREAHALGIVHRDLKPANVMLLRHGDDEDFVKVLDFGLVKFFAETPDRGADDEELTQGGIFLGSPTYMAPEQAQNQADPRSDVYSLGIVLYHMLAGRPPFQGKAPMDIILKQVNEPPPPFAPDLKIPADLDAVVRRALHKQPEYRFQSMEEFLEALKRCGTLSPSDLMMMEHSAPSRPSTNPGLGAGRPPPLKPRPPAPPLEPSGPDVVTVLPRSPWVVRGLAGLAVLVGAGLGLLLIGVPRKPRAEPEVRVAPTPAPEAPAVPPPAPVAPPAPPAEPPPAAVRELRLRIDSTPAGATVRNGDRILGQTPLDLPFSTTETNPRVVLQLEADGYESATVDAVEKDGVLLGSAALKRSAGSAHTSRRSAKKSGHPNGYKDDPYQ